MNSISATDRGWSLTMQADLPATLLASYVDFLCIIVTDQGGGTPWRRTLNLDAARARGRDACRANKTYHSSALAQQT